MSEYREQADVEEPTAKIEDGLRDVLMALQPFNEEETTRILLAVAALYDLPIIDLDLAKIGGGVEQDDEVTE